MQQASIKFSKPSGTPRLPFVILHPPEIIQGHVKRCSPPTAVIPEDRGGAYQDGHNNRGNRVRIHPDNGGDELHNSPSNGGDELYDSPGNGGDEFYDNLGDRGDKFYNNPNAKFYDNSGDGGGETHDSGGGEVRIHNGPGDEHHDDNNVQGGPHAQVEWGADIAQDPTMLAYGFFVNTKWKVAICMTCKTGVCADALHAHLKKDLKEVGLTAPRTYCVSVAKDYGIPSRAELRLPTSIIPAVYGLPIESDMRYCGNCGYAARRSPTISRHQDGGFVVGRYWEKKCKGSGIRTGYAQTFFPKTNRDFFAVEVPLAKTSKPDEPIPISTRFMAQLSGPPSDSLITVPSDSRNMNHFLTLGNWFKEVNGLTGKEAYHITRDSLPDLHGTVRKSVKSYVKMMNVELEAEDDGVKVAMGDYNK